MLPDVFEWPIATDDWDTTYGRRRFLSRFLCISLFTSYVHCIQMFPFSSSTGMIWTAEYAIAKLNEKYGKQVLISFFIGTDDRDSNTHILHVGVRNNRLLILHTNTNPCLLLFKTLLHDRKKNFLYTPVPCISKKSIQRLKIT